MAKILGRLVNVGFGKETTRGTAVSVDSWVPRTELTVQDKAEYISDTSAQGNLYGSAEMSVSKISGLGNIGGNVQVNSFGFLLLSALGQVTSEETSGTGAYEHTFSTLSSNSHPSLTLGVNCPVEGDLAFALASLNSLTISIEANGFATYAADFMSKGSESTTHTVSYTTDYTLLAGQGGLYFADTLSGIGAADINCVKSMEIVFEKNLEETNCLFSTSPIDYVNKAFNVTGSFVADFETTTFQDYHKLGTKKAMRLVLEDTNTTIGVSDNPSLTIDFSKVAITEFDKAMGNDEIVTQTATFTSMLGDDGKFVEAKLINTKTSY